MPTPSGGSVKLIHGGGGGGVPIIRHVFARLCVVKDTYVEVSDAPSSPSQV